MHIPCFFYGSYMDPDVLRRFGADPGASAPAVLNGWRLTFTPHANIRPDQFEEVHGVVYQMSHAELDRLYGPSGYVTTYKPVPLTVGTPDGDVVAMSFVEEAKETAPDGSYLDSFLSICRRMGHPDGYVDGLRARAENLIRGTIN